jgi:hypothetical protein
MLQHRDTPSDEIKRRDSWATKLQVRAMFYSNHDDIYFSKMLNADYRSQQVVNMKKHMLDKVLPSLFTVLQSYEQYTAQGKLWRYKHEKDFPKGNVIEWQPIPWLNRSKAKIKADGSPNVPIALDGTVETKWDITDHFQPISHEGSDFHDYRCF